MNVLYVCMYASMYVENGIEWEGEKESEKGE